MRSRHYIQNIENFNLSKPSSLTQLNGFEYIVGHVEQNSLSFLFRLYRMQLCYSFCVVFLTALYLLKNPK